MSYNPPAPVSPPDPSEFAHFKRKTAARDCVIYAVVSVIVLGMAGVAAYYFTRPQVEKTRLRAKMERTLNTVGLMESKVPMELPQLKDPKRLDGLLGEEATTEDVAMTAARRPREEAVASSSYSGGGRTGVTLSDDPSLPKATPAFIAFAETLKVSGVLEGNSPKAMFNGRVVRVGAVIDAESGVIFAGVDGAKKTLRLRDKTGAELLLAY